MEHIHVFDWMKSKDEPTMTLPHWFELVCCLPILKPQDWLHKHGHAGFWNQKWRFFETRSMYFDERGGWEKASGGFDWGSEGILHAHQQNSIWLKTKLKTNWERVKISSKRKHTDSYKCTQHLENTSVHFPVLSTINDLATYLLPSITYCLLHWLYTVCRIK